MPTRSHSMKVIAGITVFLSLLAIGQQITKSHLGLNWQAPNRWVHVDNLDPKKAGLFEGARKRWLAVLRKDGGLLGDGRPLFWRARSSGGGVAYFSFYPFGTWTDLDARREMIGRTEKIAGENAVKAYDSGDEALISPHYSQIWRRMDQYDIAWPGGQSLTELNASAGRLEVRCVEFQQWDVFESAWKQVSAALQAGKYPLDCRAFMSLYGKGEFMVWWLAPDLTGYRKAPAYETVLRLQLGQQRSAELLATLGRVFPLRESYEVQRCPDLCNLGQ